MTRCIRNVWKHTVGILISIEKGACFEDKKTAGFTHIAEHLCFSGTEKRTRYALRDIQDRIFNELEATTGYNEVRIFCYVDKTDVAEALQMLYEIIYKWKCRREDFKVEKEDLISEAHAYRNSYQRKIQTEISKLLFSKPKEIMGHQAVIEKLRERDIPEIKRYWKKLLSDASIDVCLLGPVGRKEKKISERLFGADGSKGVRWMMKKAAWVESTNGIGIRIEHNTRHPFLLLISQILTRRFDEQMGGEVSFESVQFQDQTLLCAVCDKPFDKNLARSIIEKRVTEKEFKTAKAFFLKRFRCALDGIDPIDSLHWFHGFRKRAYRSLPSEDPKAIYDFYKRVSFVQIDAFYQGAWIVSKN